eukprot:GHVQ01029340.1.p2 GENE.GHVQ01029340.1~~GHVQ01029340.1.p2  ORF type:complete len:121 (+),score=15.13 GHVQ01029340.1:41-403(+)
MDNIKTPTNWLLLIRRLSCYCLSILINLITLVSLPTVAGRRSLARALVGARLSPLSAVSPLCVYCLVVVVHNKQDNQEACEMVLLAWDEGRSRRVHPSLSPVYENGNPCSTLPTTGTGEA